MRNSNLSRLDKVEQRIAPRIQRRQVFIWDDGSPGCVEREFAGRVREGVADPGDEVVAVRWRQSADDEWIA